MKITGIVIDNKNLIHEYDLIILNMISGTCNIPSPTLQEINNILSYIKLSMPIFLLHGASAAFWQWGWWRKIVGFRWVRKDDPDNFQASVHPVCPYDLKLTKSRHPLCKELKEISFPEDELYTKLEQTCEAVTIMDAVTEKGKYPMCYETTTPWFGKIIGYLPGHKTEVISIPENIHNCKTIINYLLN